jgi:hypothetical protein
MTYHALGMLAIAGAACWRDLRAASGEYGDGDDA